METPWLPAASCAIAARKYESPPTVVVLENVENILLGGWGIKVRVDGLKFSNALMEQLALRVERERRLKT